jgi:hypothetical protein
VENDQEGENGVHREEESAHSLPLDADDLFDDRVLEHAGLSFESHNRDWLPICVFSAEAFWIAD